MDKAITKGIHHPGLTVSRLEDSADFFVSQLGWKIVRRNEEYPAIYLSDGTNLLTLRATQASPSTPFDKQRNVGLHHVAFRVESEPSLNDIHRRLSYARVEIEFAPEPLGNGPARHMMCYEPSGIRVELIWPGNPAV